MFYVQPINVTLERHIHRLHPCCRNLKTLNLNWTEIFQYADPVANLLDKWNVFRSRLFREACVFHRGNYVKDLSRLGRDLQKVVIMDNSPASYVFHPDNAVRFRIHWWCINRLASELISSCYLNISFISSTFYKSRALVEDEAMLQRHEPI